MTEALLEPQAPSTNLDEMRNALVAAYGLEISEQPLKLDAEQEKAILEGFGGNLTDVQTDTFARVDSAHVSRNVVLDAVKERVVAVPQTGFSELQPGQAMSLMRPESEFARGFRQRSNVRSETAVASRTHAVRMALVALGVHEDEFAPYLEKASGAVYNSTANGAPLITERIIPTPQGDIHEMNLHGAGSTEVIDTEVVVVRK